MDAEEISLGFLEVERRVPRWFFPSKVGGLPTWHVWPAPTNLFCAVCTPQVPLTLLVQIYAPIDGPSFCFHRTLYVFCCLSCGSHFRAISSCLPRDNAEYPNCALSTYFESKEVFWRHWREQEHRRKGMDWKTESDTWNIMQGPAAHECSSSGNSSSSTEPPPSAAASAAAPEAARQSQGHKVIDESTKVAIVKQLQRGERLRQVCCCPVCGLAGGEIVEEKERTGSAALLLQQLQRSERRLQVLLRQQQEAAAAMAGDDEEDESESAPIMDLDLGDFETQDTEADQRGLLLLDAAHIQEQLNTKTCNGKGLDAAMERLGLQGDGEQEALTHEEMLLRRYQQTIQETPDADLDESEADAFEEIHQKYSTQDPQLEVFLKRCGSPEVKGHALRYALAGRPLWPFSSNQLKEEDVPACACGAKRQFEFQVQPQIISQLAERVAPNDPAATASLERLCFGLLAIYTCSASCDSVSPCRRYREEFVYAQPDPFYG